MENRIIFRETLTVIKEAADAAGGIITKEEVRSYLKDLPLEEEHFQMIYDYLKSQNIRVADDEEEAAEAVTEEEGRSLAIYLEELGKLECGEDGDEQKLFAAAMNREPGARDRLIEWYLPLICEMAEEYQGEDILAEDLIQEGNLGLLTALEALAEYESVAAFRAGLINAVSSAMEEAIGQNQRERQGGEGIAGRANHLNEAVKNLEEELEHKVSVEELSAYLEMPVEEIRDILRMSGDQIELEK